MSDDSKHKEQTNQNQPGFFTKAATIMEVYAKTYWSHALCLVVGFGTAMAYDKYGDRLSA